MSVKHDSLSPVQPQSSDADDLYTVVLLGCQYTITSLDIVQKKAEVRPATFDECMMFSDALRLEQAVSPGNTAHVHLVEDVVATYLKNGDTEDDFKILRITPVLESPFSSARAEVMVPQLPRPRQLVRPDGKPSTSPDVTAIGITAVRGSVPPRHEPVPTDHMGTTSMMEEPEDVCTRHPPPPKPPRFSPTIIVAVQNALNYPAQGFVRPCGVTADQLNDFVTQANNNLGGLMDILPTGTLPTPVNAILAKISNMADVLRWEAQTQPSHTVPSSPCTGSVPNTESLMTAISHAVVAAVTSREFEIPKGVTDDHLLFFIQEVDRRPTILPLPDGMTRAHIFPVLTGIRLHLQRQNLLTDPEPSQASDLFPVQKYDTSRPS